MTLRARLTIIYLLATIAVFAAAAALVRHAYAAGSATVADRTLMRAIDEAEESLSLAPSTPIVKIRLAQFLDGHPGLFINARDSRLGPIFQSDSDIAWPNHATTAIVSAGGSRVLWSHAALRREGRLRLASLFLPAVGGVWLDLGWPLPPPLKIFAGWQAGMVILFSALFAGNLAWIGWWLAGRAMAPLQEVTRVARKVSRGALNERIPRPGNDDDVSRLIDVVNAMLERVEKTTGKLAEFAANVSHQLKTPLTILRGQTEVALNGRLSEIGARRLLKAHLRELESLSTLVADMLAYARMESSPAEATRSARLDQVVESVAQKAVTLSKPKHQRIVFKAEALSVYIAPIRLEQALLNVVDNAVRHTPEHGRITLSVYREGKRAVVSIEDTGPGISSYAQGRLFKRGISTTSTGIGLGLARNLVESIGGRLEALSLPSRGLIVRVFFPLAGH